MNDMTNGVDQEPGTIGRRDLLKKGAAAGAIVWTTPMILSETALAAGGGTPECRPVITAACERYDCDQGGKWMPGIRITVGPCVCSDTTPPERPDVCVRVVPPAPPGVLASCGDALIYRSPTTCGPNPEFPDEIVTPNVWECVSQDENSSFFVFFGQERNGNGNGAIDELSDGCIFTFRLDVWAGGCPTEASTDDAYTCESYNVVLRWDQGTVGDVQGGYVTCTPTAECPTCGFNPAPGDPGCVGATTTSPCGTCA